jgi:hypothetical protein
VQNLHSELSSSKEKEEYLKKCTVAIREHQKDVAGTIGTGVIVTEDGLILTCYHVIGDVRNRKPYYNIVDVYFTEADATKQAEIAKEYCDPSLDIAFLRLIGEDKKLPQNSAVAYLNEKIYPVHKFKSFGFRKPRQFTGLFSDVKILGETKEISINASFSQDVLQLSSNEIEAGMSGAAVLDIETNMVVGIVFQHNDTRGTVDTNLNFAIPVSSIVEKSQPASSILKQKNPGLSKVNEFLWKIGMLGVKNYQMIDSLFVPPTEYEVIRNALATNHIVFITGPPEYGKTYTAVRLLWEYFNHDSAYTPVYYQWVENTGSVAKKLIEIEDTLEPRHIYYYEDPFGKTKYEHNTQLQRSISNIIDTAATSHDTYVIITSREEIFKEFQDRNSEIKNYEQKLVIKTPSYNYDKRKEMLLKRAESENSAWLGDNDTRNAILKWMEEAIMLPTPLNIKNFVDAIKKKTDKQEILDIMKKKSKQTAESFGKEIEDMIPHHPDRMIFLSFPFISESYSVDFVEAKYEELIKDLEKELNLVNPWKFAAVYEQLEDKIENKDGRLRFSHPSYSEAIKYIISEDRFITKAAEILGKVLLKLAGYSAYEYLHSGVSVKYTAGVAGTVAANFGYLPSEVQELLFDLAKNKARAAYVVYAVASNYDNLPENVQKLLFDLAKSEQAAVARAVDSYFSNLPQDVRNRLLLEVAVNKDALQHVVHTVASNYDNLPENVQKLLFDLAKSEQPDVAKAIVDNFSNLPQDVRNRLLLEASVNKDAVEGVVYVVASNYDNLPENVQKLLFDLAKNKYTVETLTRVLFDAEPPGHPWHTYPKFTTSPHGFFDKLPKMVGEKLLSMTFGTRYVANLFTFTGNPFGALDDIKNGRVYVSLSVVDDFYGDGRNSDYVNDHFEKLRFVCNKMPDDVRNCVLANVISKEENVYLLSASIVYDFDKLPDDVRSYILIKLADMRNEPVQQNVSIAVARHFGKLPENLRNDILAKLSTRWLEWIVSVRFDKIPEDQRNDILLKLGDKKDAAKFVARIVVNKFDKVPEDVRKLLFRLAENPDTAEFIKSAINEDTTGKLPDEMRNELQKVLKKN